MFDFFKRTHRPSTDAGHANRTHTARALSSCKTPASLDPLPVPEVSEGNTEADWSMWEDSVAFQNSQMPQDSEATMPAPLLFGSYDVTVPGDLTPTEDAGDPFSDLPKHTL